jgi:hypothetical protein
MNSQRLPKLLLWLAFMVVTVVASAQERTVTGKVSDIQTGAPVQGVTVRVKGTTAGTSTNATGEFSLKVPSSDSVLVYSNVGN